jgi:hypothetical protein
VRGILRVVLLCNAWDAVALGLTMATIERRLNGLVFTEAII